jgi:hypothetical protein
LDASSERGTHGKAGLQHPPCKRNATARAVEGNLGGFCVGNHALIFVRLAHDRRFVIALLFFVVLFIFIFISGRHSVADDQDGTFVDQTGAKLLGDESDHVASPIAQAAVANFSNAELFRRLRSRSPEAACLSIAASEWFTRTTLLDEVDGTQFPNGDCAILRQRHFTSLLQHEKKLLNRSMRQQTDF